MGKTTLAQMLPEAIFMNCDLPSVARRLEDPELFFRAHPRDTVIALDEVHRLPDPSRILKIAADAFPRLKFWPPVLPLWLLPASSGIHSPGESLFSFSLPCSGRSAKRRSEFAIWIGVSCTAAFLKLY